MAEVCESRKTVSIGKVKVAVVKGDICSEKADVIVSSVSNNLDLMKGRASKALLKAAGEELQEQCRDNYPDGLDNDEIAVLNPGNLNCKKVYLVSLMKWAGDTEEKALCDIVLKCLDEAEQWKTQTIAVPSLGTGLLKYPADKVASLMFQCIEDFSSQNLSCHLKTVSIVIHNSDTAAFKAFVSEARKRVNAVSQSSRQTTSCQQQQSKLEVTIKSGKLATFKADVIVDNTASSLQLKNGGLSESLLEMAGPEMQDECDNNYPNGIKIGEIAVTGGYGLNCKKVYHGTLSKWSDKSQNAITLTTKFVTDCLELASKYSAKSIAFPTLGTGGLGHPHKIAASAMHKGICDFEETNQTTAIKYITIVVYDGRDKWKEVQQVFEQEFHFRGQGTSQHSFQLPTAPTPQRSSQACGPDFFKQMYKSEQRPPRYWKTFHSGKTIKDWDISTKDKKAVRYKVDQATFDAVENLVQVTWQNQYVGQGKDAAGLQNLNYTHIVVKKVERVENIYTFKKYVEHRNDHFKKAVSANGPLPRLEGIPLAQKGPVQTSQIISKDGILHQEIYPDINEHYLFHGTKADLVDTIVNQGLDSRLAGDKAMFGPGVYCAESSTKADQYSDYKGNRSSGSLKMFLVRLSLGDIYVQSSPTQYKRAPCKACEKDKCTCTGNDFYDSVVGDGMWNFREFVVYEKTQSYPEYLITYERR